MFKWVIWVRTAILLAVILLVSGCLGLPTLEITPSTVPTTLPPTETATSTPVTIEITGDVNVRYSEGKVKGWLYRGDRVQATCIGDWCEISGGNYNGYHFWRGCSSDNPEGKSCRTK